MPQLVDLAQFRTGARQGKPPEGGIVRVQIGSGKAVEDGRRALRFCFSDGSIDRAGDTIAPAGWQLDGFLKNPVALWAHDSSAPPIGRASHLVIEDARLMGDIEFAAAEVYPFADTIYQLCLGKFINAVSVGFLPIEYAWSNEDDRQYGLDFEEQELLEISVVPVPCNSNALAEARAKGIDTGPVVEWAEKLLDGGGRVIVPRTEIERLRKAAKGSAMTTRSKPGAQRRDGDGGENPAMTEGDPADGSFAMNCGRKSDDECSAADPEQCAVHGPSLKRGKGIAALVRREVKAALEPITAALKGLAARRREAGEDDDTQQGDPEKCLRAFRAHVKAMGDAADDLPGRDDDPDKHDEAYRKMVGHHKDAGDALDDYREAVGVEGDDDPGEKSAEDDPEDEAGKAARLARVKELRASIGA